MIPQSTSMMSMICARRLYRLAQPILSKAVAKHKADRYRKHFGAQAHIWMLLLHIMNGSQSLRQSNAEFGVDTRLHRRLGLRRWVSFSQLARSSTSRPSACFEHLLNQLVQTVQHDRGANRVAHQDGDWHLLQQAKALDSTFLALSAKLSPWSCQGKHPAGVRLQVGLDLATRIPDTLLLGGADLIDHNAIWQLYGSEQDLERLRGWTLVMDLGYYGHRLFKHLLSAGVHLLSKLHPQAAYQVNATRKVKQKQGWTPKEDQVLQDCTITLGSPNNRQGAVLSEVRLVTSRTPGGHICHLITDRFDLQAWEVVALYRKRWQIELFFRWLKRQLNAIRPLGHSRQAVWLTVLVALIAALMWLLVEGFSFQPKGMTRICWLRAVAIALQFQTHAPTLLSG